MRRKREKGKTGIYRAGLDTAKHYLLRSQSRNNFTDKGIKP